MKKWLILKELLPINIKSVVETYFHMQTPDDQKDNNPNTSEGIVVFTGNKDANVKVGNLVSVEEQLMSIILMDTMIQNVTQIYL